MVLGDKGYQGCEGGPNETEAKWTDVRQGSEVKQINATCSITSGKVLQPVSRRQRIELLPINLRRGPWRLSLAGRRVGRREHRRPGLERKNVNEEAT